VEKEEAGRCQAEAGSERLTETQQVHGTKGRVRLQGTGDSGAHGPHNHIARERSIQDQEVEMLVIPMPHAIVDPWAMVIHL